VEGLKLIVVSDMTVKKKTDRKIASYPEYTERVVGEQLEVVAKAKDLHWWAATVGENFREP